MAPFLAGYLAGVASSFALAGVIMQVYGSRRANKRLRSAGVIVFAIGIVFASAYFLIDTGPEQVENNTRQIVADVDGRNWTDLRGLLDSQTSLDFGDHTPSGPVNLKGGDEIVRFIQSEATKANLRNVAITDTRIEHNGDWILIALAADGWMDGSVSRPAKSSWKFNWFRRGGTWHLDSIKLTDLNVPGQNSELIRAMYGDTSGHDASGAIVLKGDQRITTVEAFTPSVTFTIVAQTDSTNIRIAYAADQIIFNWEVNPDQMRIDGGPANGRHTNGAGRIPINQWVTIELRVLPTSMRILVDGKQRFATSADFSRVNQSLSVFAANGSTVKVKSIKVMTP
jgi:hypothetical protein